MGNQCNTCSDPRPDALRTIISPTPLCEAPCESCTDNCPPAPCNCPVHLNGTCVHYTGCETFITQLKAGKTFDEVVIAIESVFNSIDRLLESYKTRIIELEDQIRGINEQLADKTKCENGFE